MGANQSSGSGGAGSDDSRPVAQTCYYELLDVDIKASDEEIKKAYRRKALELHPDRNYGNVEAATAQFADVQTAYEILSDPQERAWYDSHRDQILRGEGTTESSSRPSHITTSEDILQLMSKFHGRVQYNDSPNGFYGALRDLFDKLAQEEEDATMETDDGKAHFYPGFGNADDNYEESVRYFYGAWSGFATRKAFSWKDLYRYSEAPDRKIRRLMEKENKRLRDEAIREFNETVRSLVAFVKKRDPRYQPSKQSEADRQKALKEAAQAQAARSRAANQAKNPVEVPTTPEWMKTSTKEDSEFQEEDWDSEQEDPKEEFECVLCDKIFKSEKQFEAHEKSKKHVKAAEQVKRQMRRENRDLDLLEPAAKDNHDAKDDAGPKGTSSPDGDSVSEGREEVALNDSDSASSAIPEREKAGARARGPISKDDSESSSLDEDYAPRETVAARIQGDNSDVQGVSSLMEDQSLGEDAPQKPKIGKAKLKKAKKASSTSSSTLKCNICSSEFPSKNRLFSHLKEQHQSISQPSKNAKGSKGKKK